MSKQIIKVGNDIKVTDPEFNNLQVAKKNQEAEAASLKGNLTLEQMKLLLASLYLRVAELEKKVG